MRGPALREAVEWRVEIWAPAVENALKKAVTVLPADARILEIGYNSGMMSCYMASQYDWNIVGYDVKESTRVKAEENARKYGLQAKIEFRVCSPRDTISIQGPFDAVFLKSVLYHISNKNFYKSWVDWLHDVVRNGGLVMAIENGKGGLLDKIYRDCIKRSRWAGFILFDSWTETAFRNRFRNVDVKYYGRISQFFSSWPKAFEIVRALEERFLPANSEHCFVASIVAQR